MAKKFLTPLNLLHSSSDPVSVPSGSVYYNTVDNVIRFYNGSNWENLSTPGGGAVSVTDVNYLIQKTLSDMGFFDGGTASGFTLGLFGGTSLNMNDSAIINGGTA